MSDNGAMSGIHDGGSDAAAYVLGALEPAEAQAFERHLLECAACRDEVEALQGVRHALPMAAAQHPVPKGLRRRVMRGVREHPQPGRVRSGGAGAGAGAGAFDPISRWGLRPILAAALAVVIAAAVITGVELPGGATTRVIQAQVTGIRGRAELRIVGNRGDLVVRHLSAPPAGHVYEVWLGAGHAKPAPAGVLFSVTSSGDAALGIPKSLHGISAVMVTPEPLGGSLSPTHAPVIVARLT